MTAPHSEEGKEPSKCGKLYDILMIFFQILHFGKCFYSLFLTPKSMFAVVIYIFPCSINEKVHIAGCF